MAKNKKTIADAYVNLIPSAEGFSSGVEKAINEGTGAAAKSAMPGFANLAMGFAQGIGQAAFGVVENIGKKTYEIAQQAIDSYAEFEQLAGGIDTLFGTGGQSVSDIMEKAGVSAQEAVKQYQSMEEAQALMMKNAEEAYMTAGMSMNEYMETSIQSAAAMINSLGGDQKKAAELMDMSIIDMSDNVNKMGTTMEAVQNAYRGFSRGNFTMLDNLALGYAGTKEGMEELLADAQKISGIEYNIDSYSDIVQAIHTVQESMGIAGTTSEEASTTIQGSINSVKAAWENLVTGLSNEDADIGNLIDKLLNTIFGDGEKQGFLDNILPRIEQLISGFGQFIQQFAERLPGIVTEYLPMFIDTFNNIFNDIINGLVNNSDDIIENIGTTLSMMVEKGFELLGNVIQAIPTIIEIALKIITTLAEGLAEAIPNLIPIILDVLTTITGVILSNLPLILDVAFQIIIALVEGILSNLGEISIAIEKVMMQIIACFIALIPELISCAIELVVAFITAFVDGILKMLTEDFWHDMLDGIVSSFTDIDWDGLGERCIGGIVNGFKKGITNIVSTAKNVAQSVKNAFSGEMEIHSPSKVFEEYGEMIDKGLSIGMESGESVTTAEELATNVNNNFIDSISGASADYNSNENARMVELMAEQNNLLWQILNKNYGRSDAEIFRTVRKESKGYLKQTGSYAF